MRAIKRINHNAAICEDNAGHELIALGKGIGFGELPREVDLDDIRRTFYGIDPKYLTFIDEVDPQVLEFSAQLADIVTQQVSYELSPNLPIALADHIQFTLKRAREYMMLSMPFGEEVRQLYPVEYKLGQMAVRGIQKTFNVRLQPKEVAGIAISIRNSGISPSKRSAQEEKDIERLFARVIKLVERTTGRKLDRNSFAFARFSTHIRYLLKRVAAEEPLVSENVELYETVCEQYPESAACAAEVDELICDMLGTTLSQEELLYLILHINRIAPPEEDEAPSERGC